LTFSLPGNDSLKGKRRVVRRIVDRTRNQFNAAVAEIGLLDRHKQAQIGFAVISNDARHANSMLDKIGAFVSGLTEAVVIERSLELVHVGESAGADVELEDPAERGAYAWKWDEEDEEPDER
jgi:uncharacterized protein YlxP (DUF503 family)